MLFCTCTIMQDQSVQVIKQRSSLYKSSINKKIDPKMISNSMLQDLMMEKMQLLKMEKGMSLLHFPSSSLDLA